MQRYKKNPTRASVGHKITTNRDTPKNVRYALAASGDGVA